MNCLHSCEDDILKVVLYEQDTLQVTKWNSYISLCDDVNTDPIGYGPAERETFLPEDRDQLYPLLAMKYVSLWDFSSTNAGWSGDERDCELCIEANLVDPSVAWELKNIFLIHFKDALAPLLIKDHRLPPYYTALPRHSPGYPPY